MENVYGGMEFVAIHMLLNYRELPTFGQKRPPRFAPQNHTSDRL